MVKKKNSYTGVSLMAGEITQAMEKVADIIEKHPEQAKKIAGGITKAVEKYLESGHGSQDAVDLYNEVMDALELDAKKKNSEIDGDDGVGYKY